MADFSQKTLPELKSPTGMTLADMLNMAKGAMEYKLLKETYEPTLEKAKAESRKSITEAEKAQRTLEPTVRQAEAQATGAEALSQSQQLDAFAKHMSGIISRNSNLVNKENLNAKDIVDAYTESWKNGPNANDPTALLEALKGLPKNGTSTQYKQFVTQNQLKSLDVLQQVEKMYPNVTQMNIGSQFVPIASGNPLTGAIPPGQIAGPGVQLGLPPTTPVVSPQTGRKELLGGVTTELSPIEQAQQDVASKDYAQNKKDYESANSTIATLKNIKSLAPSAYTGVGSDYKRLLTGIANAIGIDVNTMNQTATDELAKNSAVLTLAGGNTDLARQIAEMATPGHKLTEKAIKDISNQLIGVQRMKQARHEFTKDYADQFREFNNRSDIFNKNADFRFFQLGDMTPSEIKEYKQSLTSAQRKELQDLAKKADEVGLETPSGK